MFAAYRVDYVAPVFVHPMLPTHRTNYLLCQPQLQAKMHLVLYAMCDIDHIAPSDLFLQVLAVAEELPMLFAEQLAEEPLDLAPPLPRPAA